VAADVVTGRPFAAQTPNNLYAIAFLLVALGFLFRPGLSPSRELTTFRVGLVSFALAAFVDNLRGLGVPGLPRQSVEALGSAVLIGCLGTVVTRRIFENAQRLVSLDRELSVARRIQEALLPVATPRLADVAIAARFRPMTAVAGDFYDFLEVDERRLGVLVADVSGHGVPAALIASMVKIAFAAQRPHAQAPAAVLDGMNDVLFGRLGGQYVTAAVPGPGSGNHALRRRGAPAASALPRRVATRGGPRAEWVAARPGSTSAVSPDGARPRATGPFCSLYRRPRRGHECPGDFFGLERVQAAIRAGAGLSTGAIADRLLNEAGAWSGASPSDDLTLVVVECA